MPWILLSLKSDSDHAQQVEDALTENGALSVTAIDAADQPLLEPGPGETPLWDQLILTGLFSDDSDMDQVQSGLKYSLKLDELPGVRIQPLEDRQWTRTWMDHFKPMKFGDRLWVCPEDFATPDPGAVNIRLDPGLAFGTGTHPTTALCLEWLDSQDLQGAKVLDYGCGSGILAIAALLLDSENAWAVDNDPQALIATMDNAIKNRVAERIISCLPDALPTAQADVCMANILAGPLTSLAPTLARQTRAKGKLILSGILCEQADEVNQCYGQWFDMHEPVIKEGWVRLEGFKKQ